MAVEYRLARPEERRKLIMTGRLGFGDSTAAEEIERSLTDKTWYRPENTLCAFDGDVVASKLAVFDFTIGWNGREIGCGGVSGVATLPSHRRRGHLRELMRRSFEHMREAGQPVAMLWASMAAIYQRFGYGAGYRLQHCDFDPRTLRFVEDMPVPGSMEIVDKDEAPAIVAEAYARFAAPRTLMLHRGDQWWRSVLLRQWRPADAPLLVAVYREAGAVLGYVVYGVEPQRLERPGPNERLIVWDFVWLTPAAHRALVQYLAGYDLVYSVRIQRLPVDDPLFFQVQEPRLLLLQEEDGTWVRLVDVQAALGGRGYEAEGRLTFALADDLCPWNSDVWQLSAEGGCARVQRSDAEPDLRLLPRALAALASGSASAALLARAGLIAGDETSLALADALFRISHAPLCLDGF